MEYLDGGYRFQLKVLPVIVFCSLQGNFDPSTNFDMFSSLSEDSEWSDTTNVPCDISSNFETALLAVSNYSMKRIINSGDFVAIHCFLSVLLQLVYCHFL